ncbi:MAG: tetratricopeptide repeat protein [Phycisphaerales bacterium]|nr:tetratricopeptide repeat protein [Phycisphaerales bacterium]
MHRILLLAALLTCTSCKPAAPPVGPPPAPRHAQALGGEVLEAITNHLETLNAAAPEAQGRRELGLLYLANGSPSEAAEALTQASMLDPSHPATWSYLGQALHQSGQPDAAITTLQSAQVLAPDHLSVWWRPGFWLLDEGRASEALPLFEQAAAIDRRAATPAADGAAYRVGLARCLMDLDRPSEAVPVLEELNTLITHPYASYLLGQAYRRSGRAEDAVRLRAATAGSPPSYPDPWQDAISAAKRGLDGRMEHIASLLESGQSRKAQLAITAALKRWPQDVNLLTRLSEWHRMQGNTKAWVRTLVQASRIDPDHAQTHHNLSIALQQAGDLQESLNQAHLAVQDKPDFSAAWLQIGRLRFVIAGLDKSNAENPKALQATLEPFDQAFALGVEASREHLLYGHLLFRAGRLTDAQRVLEQLILRADADPRAWAVLSEVLSAQNLHRDALSTAIDGLNLFPGQSDLTRIAERYRRAMSGSDGS